MSSPKGYGTGVGPPRLVFFRQGGEVGQRQVSGRVHWSDAGKGLHAEHRHRQSLLEQCPVDDMPPTKACREMIESSSSLMPLPLSELRSSSSASPLEDLIPDDLLLSPP